MAITSTGGSAPKKRKPMAKLGKKALGLPERKVQAAAEVYVGKRARQYKKAAAARKTVRKVTRAAVRKGISGLTEDSLGITRQEGGRAIRKAVKTIGLDKATKVAAKTRLRQGQTYKGGKGKAPGMWTENKTKAAVRRRKSR